MATNPTNAPAIDAARIGELRRIAEAATPGPWTADHDLPYNHRPRVHSDNDTSLICECGNCGTGQDQWEADAAFIAVARNALSALLDEIEALRKERDEALRDLAIANRGGLDLLYEIREALGWNDKTSLDILPRGVKEMRERCEKAEADRDDMRKLADAVAEDSIENFNAACQEKLRAEAAEADAARLRKALETASRTIQRTGDFRFALVRDAATQIKDALFPRAAINKGTPHDE